MNQKKGKNKNKIKKGELIKKFRAMFYLYMLESIHYIYIAIKHSVVWYLMNACTIHTCNKGRPKGVCTE